MYPTSGGRRRCRCAGRWIDENEQARAGFCRSWRSLRSFDLLIFRLRFKCLGKDRSLVALDSSYTAPTQLLHSSSGGSHWAVQKMASARMSAGPCLRKRRLARLSSRTSRGLTPGWPPRFALALKGWWMPCRLVSGAGRRAQRPHGYQRTGQSLESVPIGSRQALVRRVYWPRCAR